MTAKIICSWGAMASPLTLACPAFKSRPRWSESRGAYNCFGRRRCAVGRPIRRWPGDRWSDRIRSWSNADRRRPVVPSYRCPGDHHGNQPRQVRPDGSWSTNLGCLWQWLAGQVVCRPPDWFPSPWPCRSRRPRRRHGRQGSPWMRRRHARPPCQLVECSVFDHPRCHHRCLLCHFVLDGVNSSPTHCFFFFVLRSRSQLRRGYLGRCKAVPCRWEAPCPMTIYLFAMTLYFE